MHRRQSPISSRKRSTTIVRSEGTTPVARSCSRTNATRFEAARGSHAHCSTQLLARPPSSGSSASSRQQLPDGCAELGRPADLLALPERDRAGHAGRGGDEHAVARDLLDPPRRGAEQEHLALARLVDHLLVELADAPAAVHEEDAEEPAVGDRARRWRSRCAIAPSRARTVPSTRSHTRRGPQLGELVGGVAARRAGRARPRAGRAGSSRYG